MKFRKNLLFLAFSFFTIFGFSQWQSIGLPRGFSFDFNYIDREGNIFLKSGELYYSNDLGNIWTDTGFDKELEFEGDYWQFIELNNNDILLKYKEKIFKFNRNKITWDSIIVNVGKKSKIDQLGRIWYFGENNKIPGLFISKDSSKSYQFIALPTKKLEKNYLTGYKDLFNIWVTWDDRDNANYYISNANRDFTKIKTNSRYHFAFINPNTGTIFLRDSFNELIRSTDYGHSFSVVDLPMNADRGVIEMKLLKKNTLLIKKVNKISYSNDDGLTWNKLPEVWGPRNLPYSGLHNSFSYTPSLDTVIALNNKCLAQGIYISKDRGVHWKYKNDGFYKPEINKLLIDETGILYAFTCSDSTVLFSTDNGKSWEKYLFHYNDEVYSITDLAIGKNGNKYIVTNYGIYKLFGKEKNIFRFNLPEQIINNKFNYRVNISQQGFLCLSYSKGDEKYISQDEGLNWLKFSIPNFSIFGLFRIDNKGDIYYLSDNITLCKYDIHTSEKIEFKVNKEINIQNFELLKDSVIFFLGRYRNDTINCGMSLFVSYDSMKSFTKIDNAPRFPNKIYADKDDNLLITTYCDLNLSSNNGKSFKYLGDLPKGYYEFEISPFKKIFAIGTGKIYSYSY